MANRIQLRRGTAAEWAAANPVLAQGEPGIEKNTGKQKFGDGVTAWLALPYASKGDPGPAGIADDASVAAALEGPLSSGVLSAAIESQGGELFALDTLFAKPVVVPDYGPTSSHYIDAIKVAGVYALWDALIAQYPAYFTTTLLGKDQSGTYDLRRITFNNPYAKQVKKRVLIVANIHGHEPNGDAKAPAIVVYEMIRNAIESNVNSEAMQSLFYDYTFEIVPIGNPWGFDNDKRTNSRNVDMNRNFAVNDWAAVYNGSTDPTSYEYKGSAPASEVETQLLQNLLASTLPDAVVDFHCWGYKGVDQVVYRYVYYPQVNGDARAKSAADMSFKHLSEKYGHPIDTADTGGGSLKTYAQTRLATAVPAVTLEFTPFVKDTDPYSSPMMTSYLEVIVNYILTYGRTFGINPPHPLTRYLYSNALQTVTTTTYVDVPAWKKSYDCDFNGIATFEGVVTITSADITSGGVYVCPILGQAGQSITYETPKANDWEMHANGGYRVSVPFTASIPVVKGVRIDVGMQFKLSSSSPSMTAGIAKFKSILRAEPIGTGSYSMTAM